MGTQTISGSSISLLNDKEHNIDAMLLSTRNGVRPLETQYMINTFIGKMPELLSQL
jgi:hypothetical protein